MDEIAHTLYCLKVHYVYVWNCYCINHHRSVWL